MPARIKKLTLLVAALLCSQVQANEPALSFSEAEKRLSLVRQTLVQQADIQSREFEAKALGNLNLPQLSLTVAGIAYEKEISFLIPIINRRAEIDIERDGIRSQVNVLWPLYTGGRTTATRQIAESRVSEAQTDLEIVRLQLLKRLSDLYFSNQMIRQVVAVREQSVQTIQTLVNKASRFQQEGLITALDKMQADVALAEANRELLLAKRQQTDLQAALTNLLEVEQLACLSTDIPQPVALSNTSDWYVEQARNANPAYRKLAEKMTQTDRLIDIEKGKNLPEFFLAGTYELNKEATPLTEPDWSVGLGFRYNFITPVGRNASVQAAMAKREQVRLTKEQTDADLKLGIESTYRAVLEHLEQYELLAQDIKLGKENTRLQNRAFEEGLATSIDVSEAELKLAAVQVKSLNAAFLYISSLAHLTQLSGQPEQLPIILPTLLHQNACSNSQGSL
jgi:outer membrane protein TolC